MSHVRVLSLVALLLLVPLAARAQAPRAAERITAPEIDGDLSFLASDLLEGRAPATRGGRLASLYIASQLRSAGVEPGVDGSYFQPVPIDVVAADTSTIRVTASGRATTSLHFPDQVVIWPGSATSTSAVRGELVFVGYGITAPEYRWDDFKGEDLRGKVLLVLVNDPPATSSEPTLFGGRAMTYYGRWTYKFEEAERRGAAGMLIIHTTERAGYPWHTVVGSWGRPQQMLPRSASQPAPLGIEGWITNTAARSLLAQAGLDLTILTEQAASRNFRPVHTGITLDMRVASRVAHLESHNVVGVVPGRDATLRHQYVAFTAHWDHLGIGPAVNGDSIYNGASDNASGVADMLAVARAAAASHNTRRSLLFVFVTAEEAGLLGSAYYTQHPTVPISDIVADVNIDGGNLLGRVRNLSVLGANLSSLGATLQRVVDADGVRISPEAHPEQGHFFRSDHFSFAKAGVPAVSIAAGDDFVGRPRGWGVEQDADYAAHRYHQPSDEYRSDLDLSGAVQLSDIVLRFGTTLADAATVPTWNTGSEFKDVREKTTVIGK
ncbi:MAG TPA: M28 family peptidase [Gemmatimonadaceae bacterium]